jgi:hypothetical protein
MRKFNLNLSFKGDRNYLHGTSIFDECFKIIKNIFNEYPEQIELKIYNILRKNPIIYLLDDYEESKDMGKVNAIMKFKSQGRHYKMIVIESNSLPLERIKYNENKITANSILNLDSLNVTSSFKNKYSFIENLVSNNKLLLTSCYKGSEWLFAKIYLSSYNNYFKTVKLTHSISKRLELVKTNIFVNGELIGAIFFSIKKKNFK